MKSQSAWEKETNSEWSTFESQDSLVIPAGIKFQLLSEVSAWFWEAFSQFLPSLDGTINWKPTWSPYLISELSNWGTRLDFARVCRCILKQYLGQVVLHWKAGRASRHTIFNQLQGSAGWLSANSFTSMRCGFLHCRSILNVGTFNKNYKVFAITNIVYAKSCLVFLFYRTHIMNRIIFTDITPFQPHTQRIQ